MSHMIVLFFNFLYLWQALLKYKCNLIEALHVNTEPRPSVINSYGKNHIQGEKNMVKLMWFISAFCKLFSFPFLSSKEKCTVLKFFSESCTRRGSFCHYIRLMGVLPSMVSWQGICFILLLKVSRFFTCMCGLDSRQVL